MRRAAELTLQSGYSHFRLEQAQVGQGSEFAGMYSSGSASIYGNAYGATAYGSGFSDTNYGANRERGRHRCYVPFG